MSKVKCPYNELDLRIAILGIDEETTFTEQRRLEVERRLEELHRSMGIPEGVPQRAAINTAVAKDNGVSVEVLVASPNYEFLVSSFKQSLADRTVAAFSEVMGLTHKQAWALMAIGSGALGERMSDF